jgi:Inorganic pyrophosphatase
VPSPKVDPVYSNVNQMSDIPASILDKVKHFFEHYKELEPGKFVKVVGYANNQVARQKIKESVDRYINYNSTSIANDNSAIAAWTNIIILLKESHLFSRDNVIGRGHMV